MMPRHRSNALDAGDVMVAAADWVGEARGAEVGSLEHAVAARTKAEVKRARRIRNYYTQRVNCVPNVRTLVTRRY
jgi:hypothetical protein